MSVFYGTIVGADAYHLARGNPGWTGSDDVKNAALLRASEALDALYPVLTWPDAIKTGNRAQERVWPLTGVYDVEGFTILVDEIPREVESATYEFAIRELVSPGSLHPDVRASERKKSVSVQGAIAVTFASVSSSSDYALVVNSVSALMANLLPRYRVYSGLAGQVNRG